MFGKGLCHSRQSCLGCKIGAHIVSHQDGGAFVDDIERFDHMLLFAVGIRRNTGGVFEVELEVAHWRRTFEGLGHHRRARGNASVFVQKSVNSAARFLQLSNHQICARPAT
jgi:hypothetical protein